MGSSKKHKKHKEKKSQYEENGNEQRPLKLVLKVPTATTASGTSSPIKQESENKPQITEADAPPKLTLAYGQDPQTGEITVHHSSSKKMKKKKSKKKHRKHSHHHSHHHHHHHRHRSSCSHHSKSSSQHHETSISTDKLGTTPTISITNSQSITQPLVPSRSPQRPPFVGKSGSKSQFQQFLSHLLKQLQRRDPQEFFAWPVTDLIAPGYSSIITRPIDFSTMKKRIEQNYYENLSRFKSDVKLMCDNAMTYNRPDTIYHKAARKLWRYAKDKIFNRDAITELAKPFPGLSNYELGFNIEESFSMEIDSSANDKVSGYSSGYSAFLEDVNAVKKDEHSESHTETVDEEDMTAEQVLQQAKKAAQAAADRLTLERPNGSHLSFLRQREDGTTTLGIVCGSGERAVSLESIVGKLSEGNPSLPPFKEDERNLVKPINSVDTLPFSSYLPALDSSNATLTPEETSLLLSAYGDDELGIQYAQSLLQFTADSDLALKMADGLLDVLTNDQHSKVVLKSLKEDEQKVIENEQMEVNEETDEIQSQLNAANNLIGELHTIQSRRLSSSTQTVKPSKEETKLAHKLSNKLCELIANYTSPGDVTDIRGVRKAMGVQVKFD